MSDTDPASSSEREPSVDFQTGDRPVRRGPIGYVEIALASGWLIVPAMQYYGTFQRTSVQFEGSAAPLAIARLDLTPVYILLIAATAVLCGLRSWVRDSNFTAVSSRTGRPDSEASL